MPHIATSGIISGLLYYCLNSLPLAVMNFVGGVFIDIDHFIDYFLQQKPTLKLTRVLDYFYEKKFRKVYAFLHSVELVFILWISVTLARLDGIWIGLAIGISHHMLFDQLSNAVHPLSYSLIYRALNKFTRDAFFKI